MPSLDVLVVEDNAALARNIADYLEPLGHRLDFAADGRSGLALALSHPFDVVILDVALPLMDGLSVCRALREKARGVLRSDVGRTSESHGSSERQPDRRAMARSNPSYQGELDGLCGPYAITNALMHIGHGGGREEVFQTACSAISRNRWPALLWEGTTFGDLKKMVGSCMEAVEGIEVTYPFWRAAPSSNAAYWQDFDVIFDDEDAVCGIVGITRPSYHWLVVTKDGGRVVFLDSDPHGPVRRVNRASLYAGQRGPRTKKWVIDRRELVVFRRTS